MFIMFLTLPYYGEGTVHNFIYHYISLKLHYTFILVDSYYTNSIITLRANIYDVRAKPLSYHSIGPMNNDTHWFYRYRTILAIRSPHTARTRLLQQQPDIDHGEPLDLPPWIYTH